MKFCHFKQKSAIWDSAKWNPQYGEEEQCLCKSYRNNNGESDTVYRETGPYISLRWKFSHRELIG
jgi:hypothetical protein